MRLVELVAAGEELLGRLKLIGLLDLVKTINNYIVSVYLLKDVISS